MQNIYYILLSIIVLSVLASCGLPEPQEDVAPLTPTNEFNKIRFNVNKEGSRTELIGLPYSVNASNCNGMRDSEKTETRSQKYYGQLDISISDALAVEIGGDINIARAMIQREISVQLRVSLGTELESTSSVKIITPPGTESVTILQWKEIWEKGTIEIIRADDTSISVLPFEALNGLTLEQISSEAAPCPGNTTAESPIVPTATQAAQSTPIPTKPPPIIPTATTSSPTLSRCDWLAANFPQSNEGIAATFGLPVERIRMIYEGCGQIANGFVIELGTSVLMTVPAGGCIDAPQDAYFSDKTVPDGVGGLRAYSGEVRAVVMTYRPWC